MRKDKLARSLARRLEQKKKLGEHADFLYAAAEDYCERSIDPATADERTFYFEEQCYVMLFEWEIAMETLLSTDWHLPKMVTRTRKELK